MYFCKGSLLLLQLLLCVLLPSESSHCNLDVSSEQPFDVCAVCSDINAGIMWLSNGFDVAFVFEMNFTCVFAGEMELQEDECFNPNRTIRQRLISESQPDSDFPTGFRMIGQQLIPGTQCNFSTMFRSEFGSYTVLPEVTCTIKEPVQCVADPEGCVLPATCSSDSGACACSCNHGFETSPGRSRIYTSVVGGPVCFNVDECALGTDNCDANATCTDTEGSFDCTCNPGFEGDGVNCTYKLACSYSDLNDCHENAECTDTEGSFNCTCNPGFEGDGVNCTDMDECALGTDNCHQNASCTDTEGSFNCTCNPGFEGDGVNCTNIDECAMGTDNCHMYAECTDTEGSFNCTCNPGFEGDGVNCTTTIIPPELTDGRSNLIYLAPGLVATAVVLLTVLLAVLAVVCLVREHRRSHGRVQFYFKDVIDEDFQPIEVEPSSLPKAESLISVFHPLEHSGYHGSHQTHRVKSLHYETSTSSGYSTQDGYYIEASSFLHGIDEDKRQHTSEVEGSIVEHFRPPNDPSHRNGNGISRPMATYTDSSGYAETMQSSINEEAWLTSCVHKDRQRHLSTALSDGYIDKEKLTDASFGACSSKGYIKNDSEDIESDFYLHVAATNSNVESILQA